VALGRCARKKGRKMLHRQHPLSPECQPSGTSRKNETIQNKNMSARRERRERGRDEMPRSSRHPKKEDPVEEEANSKPSFTPKIAGQRKRSGKREKRGKSGTVNSARKRQIPRSPSLRKNQILETSARRKRPLTPTEKEHKKKKKGGENWQRSRARNL